MNIKELKYEIKTEDGISVSITQCPHIDCKVGSYVCVKECDFNKGTSHNIIKCSYSKTVVELFNCACPYCDSEHFEQIQCELDDTRAYIVAKCLDCDKKFDLTYACVKIDKIKEK